MTPKLTAALSAFLAPAAFAASPSEPPPAPPGSSLRALVENAPDSAWREVAAEDMAVARLADGRRFVIELTDRFAPVHAANVRALIRAGRFDGADIPRVQDNYVVQWTAPSGPAPAGFVARPPQEYERAGAAAGFVALPHRDTYAAQVGYAGGWPAASDGRSHWPAHCYGAVGVGREAMPDTGSGEELYVPIGHAPRQLDRNLAIVGRVVSGMEVLSGFARGTEPAGFYRTEAERPRIVSLRLASDLPAAERPRLQVMDTGSPTFAAWLKAVANRADNFFPVSAGAIDLCNAQPPIRAR